MTVRHILMRTSALAAPAAMLAMVLLAGCGQQSGTASGSGSGESTDPSGTPSAAPSAA